MFVSLPSVNGSETPSNKRETHGVSKVNGPKVAKFLCRLNVSPALEEDKREFLEGKTMNGDRRKRRT